jgi:hypothetical protein
MGFRCTWIALRGGTRDGVLLRLQLWARERSDEPVYDPGLYGASLPGGWYLAIGDGGQYMTQLKEAHASSLSRNGEALFFYTDDTPMCTRLASYQRGELAWAITYDGSNGVGEPDIFGKLPESSVECVERVRAEQAGAGGRDSDTDYIYGLTMYVAEALIGFRHDETLSDGGIKPIDILARQA